MPTEFDWQVPLSDVIEPTLITDFSLPTDTNKVVMLYDEWEGQIIMIAGPPGLEVETLDEEDERIPYFEPFGYSTVAEFDAALQKTKDEFAALDAMNLTEAGRKWVDRLREGQDYDVFDEERVAEWREEVREDEDALADSATHCNGYLDAASGTIKHRPLPRCPKHPFG